MNYLDGLLKNVTNDDQLSHILQNTEHIKPIFVI